MIESIYNGKNLDTVNKFSINKSFCGKISRGSFPTHPTHNALYT